MKNLFLASLLLVSLSIVSSCKKSAEVVNYRMLDSGEVYVVKAGTMTVNASTKIIYDASKDKIRVLQEHDQITVTAVRNTGTGDIQTDIQIRKDTKGTLFNQFFAWQSGPGTEVYDGMGPKGSLNDYNNKASGILIDADITCNFVNFYNTVVQFPGTCSIKLQLNKK